MLARFHRSSRLTADSQWLNKTEIDSQFIFFQLRLARALLFSAIPQAKLMDTALPRDRALCTTRKPRESLPRASHWLQPVT